MFGGGELAHVAEFLESYWNFDSEEDGIVADQIPNSTHAGELRNGAELSEEGEGYGGKGRALDPSAEENAHMLAADAESYDFNVHQGFNRPSQAHTLHIKIEKDGQQRDGYDGDQGGREKRVQPRTDLSQQYWERKYQTQCEASDGQVGQDLAQVSGFAPKPKQGPDLPYPDQHCNAIHKTTDHQLRNQPYKPTQSKQTDHHERQTSQ